MDESPDIKHEEEEAPVVAEAPVVEAPVVEAPAEEAPVEEAPAPAPAEGEDDSTPFVAEETSALALMDLFPKPAADSGSNITGNTLPETTLAGGETFEKLQFDAGIRDEEKRTRALTALAFTVKQSPKDFIALSQKILNAPPKLFTPGEALAEAMLASNKGLNNAAAAVLANSVDVAAGKDLLSNSIMKNLDNPATYKTFMSEKDTEGPTWVRDFMVSSIAENVKRADAIAS